MTRLPAEPHNWSKPTPEMCRRWDCGGALAQRRGTCLPTATIMFAANLTLGLYAQLGPRNVTPNTTVGLEGLSLQETEQPLATPTSYITLVPLLATMLFIMGR